MTNIYNSAYFLEFVMCMQRVMGKQHENIFMTKVTCSTFKLNVIIRSFKSLIVCNVFFRFCFLNGVGS